MINLANGGCLLVDFVACGITLYVGDVCLDEATRKEPQATLINEAVASGQFNKIPPNTYGFEELQDFTRNHGVGAGESECILAAKKLDLSVLTDDRKARSVAEEMLGKSNAVGVPMLLRVLVNRGVMTGAVAVQSYDQMRAAGAFLPPLAAEYFSLRLS